MVRRDNTTAERHPARADGLVYAIINAVLFAVGKSASAVLSGPGLGGPGSIEG